MDIILKYFDDLSGQQKIQLDQLKALYKEWNQKINVISRKDLEHFYERHVLHSLAIATQFDFPPGSSVLDLGCGGGFPGIPLAILYPETKFHLVDSIQKKIKVVKEVACSLALNNVSAEATRVENIRNRKFDAVVSRAVASLGALWEWSRPLLKSQFTDINNPSGLICLKGGDLKSEIASCRCRVRLWEIGARFSEPWFREKYLLQVSKKP